MCKSSRYGADISLKAAWCYCLFYFQFQLAHGRCVQLVFRDVNSLLQTLHWLPAEQRINYKLAVLTFKTQQTSSPQLNQHISLRTSARNTRSSFVPLLCVPFRRTSFARLSFSTAAPLTWNSLPPAVLNYDSLSTFKSRLKTHLFSTAFS